ncbi:odorant receptor 4-like [Tribolium madens]|uniref:odorant receptor 4-like n=1 Tax=Tribolium madens TaxID=41895 RepID=UPI001CF75005|nr:odorant receptor 4-like [Tribolium madens]
MTTTKNLKEIPSNYLRVHLTVLQWLGIDILPVENIPLGLFYIYTVLMFIAMCFFLTAEFLDIVINYEDIYKLSFTLCYYVTQVLGTAKMFLMFYMRKTLRGYLTALENGIFKPNPARGGVEELELVNDAISLCNRQGYVFYTLVFLAIGARLLYASLANWPYDKHNYMDGNVTVIVTTKVMPYATWMPFDYNDSPLYESVFAFQIFSTFAYGIYIGAADAVICGFMMLIKAQFLIVKRELETLIERAQKAAIAENSDNKDDFAEGIERVELLNEKTQEFVKKLTSDCVYHHQELIAMCDHAEEDFNYLMLSQFICSLLVVCLQLFQLTFGSAEFFSMVFFLILILFQILCYCWHGNEVQLVSGELSRNAFEINWIIMKESSKTSLLLLMMRAQRPCYFTAGKFSILSLQTFMAIVRGAGSYFMFLKRMNA